MIGGIANGLEGHEIRENNRVYLDPGAVFVQ